MSQVQHIPTPEPSERPKHRMEERGRDPARVEEKERPGRRGGELKRALSEREGANTEDRMGRERVRAGKRVEGLVGQKDRRILELESHPQHKDFRIAELESQSQRKDLRIAELESQSQRKDLKILELEDQSQYKDRRILEVESQSQRQGLRIAKLESDVRNVRGDYDGAMEQNRAITERLKQSEELSAARSAELSGTHAFLSTTDRLSEVEVLEVVRDLNENIFQVAVRLTDEWGKLESSRPTGRTDANLTFRHRPPVLTQLARNRDHTGLTFLLQSRLCSQVVAMTSGWSYYNDLTILESVYERLSASGECCIAGSS